METLFAHTPANPDYPPYINLSKGDDGTYTVTVRSPRKTDGSCGDSAAIVLDATQIADLRLALEKDESSVNAPGSKELENNKAWWLQECALQYEVKANVTSEQSAKLAQGAWESSIEAQGSEQAVLRNVAPDDAANADMEYWDGE